ncbi:PEP-CTERM sorting domain-containing protein [Rhodocyclus tenuis]|uniref:Ice-binding protein C-terminal domain-containing protein n=1 Tax=Rhodocyclus tenuis TaxID=1066 RepID=A0A840G901_RHOTE|nr:PEP-CTERM sorting domain-containing protein [Rhodocyclus tenuis]MBB4248326.1 hypothetical protein [Rhodocyclus tenuis]
MNFKLKMIAAAAAMVVAGGANAAFEDFASGNSSLGFFAIDNTGTNKSSTFIDLLYNYEDFKTVAATAGTKIVWNFNTNSLTVNGVSQTAGSWSSAFTAFQNAGTLAGSDKVQWGVYGGDSVSSGDVPGDYGYLVTSTSTLSTIKTQQQNNMSSFSLANSLYIPANQKADGDASTALNGTAINFVGASYKFGTQLNFQGKAAFKVAANEGVDQSFYLVDNSNIVDDRYAGVTQFGAGSPFQAAKFSYSAGVLTYTVPVPEPESYAMLLAGLGMLGFMARRRLGNRV